MNSSTARATRKDLPASQIPMGARIIAIADAYDTITSERTYKKARTPEEAFLELDRCGNAQFDPELVRMFISRLRELPNPLILNPALAQEPEVFHRSSRTGFSLSSFDFCSTPQTVEYPTGVTACPTGASPKCGCQTRLVSPPLIA